ncbi:MAG: putative membrane protein [Parcubacteria group bacterium Athens1014_10]|nr:MAG: putative membrane protein [Parcubacteria group bacterium Athens1014_10]
MLNKIIQKPAIRQFVKFCFVGGFNTFLDFFIYTILTRFAHFYFLLANLFSICASATSSFFLNKKWTFKNKDNKVKEQYLKFWGIIIVGAGFNQAILFFLVKYLGVYDLLAKAVAVAVLLFWNFFMGKYWVFKNYDKNSKEGGENGIEGVVS